MAAAPENQWDIVVYGATGFTGRAAAEALARVDGLKLAIAGRNQAKLEAVADHLPHRPGIIVAESNDREAIRAMVKSAEVIVNFAGPFALYGEEILAAVADLGKTYCDISGETPFYKEMIDKYQARAVASGAVIIPMAGFDSVPADLLHYLLWKKADNEGWTIDRLDHYYQVRGGFNGGTVASMLNESEKKSMPIVTDDNVLIPDRAWPHARNTLAFTPKYEPELKRWSAPFAMHYINAAVVRRSNFLHNPKAPERGQVTYLEHMVAGPGLVGQTKACVIAASLKVFESIIQKKTGRLLLKTVAPHPGQGPSERARQEGFYRGTLLAREGAKVRGKATMKVEGDPGNIVTVLCATETAKLLWNGKAQQTGFTTVSQAFGDDLIASLRSRGVAIDIA